jgi:hypothetical protein
MDPGGTLAADRREPALIAKLFNRYDTVARDVFENLTDA